MAKKNKLSVAGRPGFSPVLPKVKLELAGHVFNLQFTFNALAHLEAATGVNSFKVVDFLNIDATRLRAMLWAAILTDQPDVTLEDVGNLLTYSDIQDVYSKLLEAWTGSRPEPKKEDEEENPPVAEDESANEPTL